MKKKILSLVMVAAMSVGLAACGGGGNSAGNDTAKEDTQQSASTEVKEEAPAEGGGEVLEFYHGYYHDESEWAPAKVMRDLYDAFAEAHADGPVQFKPIAVENRAEITQNMISGGSFPNVTDLAGDAIPLAAISGGLILDLKPYIDENGLKDAVGLNYVQNLTADGKIYSVHDQLLTRGVWYNSDVLKGAGFGESDILDWDKFENVVSTLASAGDGNYAYIAGQGSLQLLQVALAENGGFDMIASEMTQEIVESDEFKDAFIKVASIDQINGSDHTTNDIGNLMADFNANGMVGVLHNGVWNAGAIGEGLEDAINPSLFPGNASIMAAGGGITIASGLSPDQEALALEFLKYMTSEEVQSVIFSEVQANPCNVNVDIEALAAASGDPVVEKLAKACSLCNGADVIVPGNNWGGDVTSVIINALMECAVSGADIPARFEKLQQEIIAIIG